MELTRFVTKPFDYALDLLLDAACRVQEGFLEDINSVLNTGDVTDLYDHEEVNSIIMSLKTAATQAQVDDTPDAIYQFFIQVSG